MADQNLEFLTNKVGPLPLWVWLLAGGGIWWYFQSSQTKTTTGSASAVPNQQTDPAGNIGSIDPATGYVYGTPEDTAALAANNAGNGGGSAGTNATTGAQKYADNNAWGIAAVNYLVGLGIDATTANEAIQQYLASQVLTTAQQGDVNLAIQALGPPPSLPGPTGTASNPVTTTGGGGGTTATNNVSVPNVIGMTKATATSTLTASGLTLTVGGGSVDPITAQSPSAGTSVAPGSSVSVTLTTPVVNTGGGGSTTTNPPVSNTVVVPNFVGMSYDQVGSANWAGLSPSYNGTLPAGVSPQTPGLTVSSQSPSAGSQVPFGTTVTLYWNNPGTSWTNQNYQSF